MKIPKIFLGILSLVIVSSALVAVTTPSSAEALTRAQQRACRTKWSGNFLASSQKVANYRESNCPSNKGGNCTDRSQRVPSPDPGGDEEIRTTITCPVDDGGGDTDTSPPAGCSGVSTNIISCGSIPSVLNTIINFLAIGVGIAVVGGIVWGAMLYTTSNGDSSKAQQGITVIVNAVIGLLVFIFMYAIINFIVPGGVL